MFRIASNPGTLGPAQVIRFGGFAVRINEDLRQTVMFVGFPDPPHSSTGLTCVGTAFLLEHQTFAYLVTCRHVAQILQDTGWAVRFNLPNGNGINAHVERVRWAFHPDETVDLAVIHFDLPKGVGPIELVALPSARIVTQQSIDHRWFGPGDACYAIGLFHLLSGKRRNLPVVHTGNIAMMPGDELIPTRDRNDKKKTTMVKGYLIECHGLPGLSGSPVLARQTVQTNQDNTFLNDVTGVREKGAFFVTRSQEFLLGVFQAQWELPPSEDLPVDRKAGVVVPLGMGIVVPAHRILEVLDMPELKGPRDEYLKNLPKQPPAVLSSLSAAARPEHPAKPIEGDDQHKERFTALLDAAVGKPKQGG